MAVEGMEELGRKLRELAQTNLTQATAQAIEIVRSAAVLNCNESILPPRSKAQNCFIMA